MDAMGLRAEHAAAYAPGQLGISIAAQSAVSPALSLAARHLAGRAPLFEFLPPRQTAWRQLAERYSSGKLQRAGVATSAAGLLLAALFGYQQWHLTRLRAEWDRIGPAARELDAIQSDIRRFRPWFDDGFTSLSALRQLTEAFPEDGAVSAKTVEIRNQTTVRCTGIARERQALSPTLEKLRASSRVSDLKVPVTQGKAPVQFTFEFRWNEGGQRAH
jgi:hypothetical protein